MRYLFYNDSFFEETYLLDIAAADGIGCCGTG